MRSIREQIPLQLNCVGALAGERDFVYGMVDKFGDFFGSDHVLFFP